MKPVEPAPVGPTAKAAGDTATAPTQSAAGDIKQAPSAAPADAAPAPVQSSQAPAASGSAPPKDERQASVEPKSAKAKVYDFDEVKIRHGKGECAVAIKDLGSFSFPC